MTGIVVMSTLGVAGVLDAWLPEYERASGGRVDLRLDPTRALLARIAGGEPADLAILTGEALTALTESGMLAAGSRVDLARSVIGVAVGEGRPHPDIATPEAFRNALLAARSLAYSRAGASGVFFAGLIERLGIAAEVNAKAVVIPNGFTGELAARGEVELAIQQVSELMAVPGVEVVGPLPAELQEVVTFSAGVFAASPRWAEAEAFRDALAAACTPDLLEHKGLLPVPRHRDDAGQG